MRYNPGMGTMIDLSKPPLKPNTEDTSRVDTEIIHPQNYDNFYSLMDRLNQRDASGECPPRILLVWPVRGRVLETPADFGRVRGWAVRNGYQIAVVIRKDDVHLKMAREQGIPAFSSLQKAQDSDWEMPAEFPEISEQAERDRRLVLLKEDAEQTRSTEPSFGTRLLFFLLALASLAAAACVIFPRARVEITPYLTRKSVDMTIWTDDRLDTVTVGGGIPTIEKKLEFTLQSVIPSTGEVRIQTGIAIGTIIVKNICERSYPSSAGVEVGTTEDVENGIRFITLDDVNLGPGEEKTVRIEAVNGGARANLPPGSIRYASYPKNLCWEVRQELPTYGGTEGIYAAPSETDRIRARQDIEDRIPGAVAEALLADPEGSDLLPLGDPVITAVKQEQSMPDTGFASPTYTLRETLEVTVRTVRRSDMEAIIRGQSARLNAQVAGLTGYEILSGPTTENGLSRWVIRADYLVYEPDTNEEALRIMLRGKTLAQAQTILDTLKHVKSARITLLPASLPRLPLAAQNIRVIIDPAVEAEEP